MPPSTRLAVLARTPLSASTDGRLPYGLDHLEAHGFSLRWSDEAHERAARRALSDRLWRRLGGAAPVARSAPEALASRHVASHSDAVFAVFEDVALTAGLMRSAGLPPYAGRPLVTLVCWLAEDLTTMSGTERRMVRRAVSGMSGVLVYSGNQADLIRDALDLADLPVAVVPFGIDTDFYHPDGQPRGERIVAVGRDRSRDYSTFMDAVRGTGLRVTLVCSEYNLRGLDVPDEVEVLLDVSHEQYRSLVRTAGVVVTPTHAPRYPGGQSTLLESMATGAPCVMTDSPAIREYVTDGVDAALVPARDPLALRRTIHDLLADDAARERMGSAAATTVRERFGYDASWTAIARALRQLTAAEVSR